MASSDQTRVDSVIVEEGFVRYQSSSETVWAFAVKDLSLIGEWTDDHGPWQDDYFYFFLAGVPAQVFEVPMYANPRLMEELGQALGVSLECRLVNSTTFSSRVIWPRELEGHDLFKYSPERRPSGLWNRIEDRSLPLAHSELTDEVLVYVRSRAG